MDSVQRQLDRIEAKLDRALDEKKPSIVNIRGVMLLTGTNSLTAAYRFLAKHSIPRVGHNQWRRLDVTNAITKAALTARGKIKVRNETDRSPQVPEGSGNESSGSAHQD